MIQAKDHQDTANQHQRSVPIYHRRSAAASCWHVSQSISANIIQYNFDSGNHYWLLAPYVTVMLELGVTKRSPYS